MTSLTLTLAHWCFLPSRKIALPPTLLKKVGNRTLICIQVIISLFHLPVYLGPHSKPFHSLPEWHCVPARRMSSYLRNVHLWCICSLKFCPSTAAGMLSSSVMLNSLWPYGLYPCQAPLSVGLFRHEYRCGVLSPGCLPNPGIKPMSPADPALQEDSLPTVPLELPAPLRDYSPLSTNTRVFHTTNKKRNKTTHKQNKTTYPP